jgi:hypothetical protein
MQNIPSAICIGILIILSGCGQKSNDKEHREDESGNKALYDEVMNVHDEVMPKMNDIYKLKEELKKRLANSPDISEEKRQHIQNTILRLDSANESMMVWMRNFNPIPDSLGEEKAREYLEQEKEKVGKVKKDVLKAIDDAKAVK